MTEIHDLSSLPRYDALMKPTLAALDALGRSGTVDEINDVIIRQLNLTPEQVDLIYPKSGAAIVPDRLSWARSYLKIAGLITNERRGLWLLTEAGRKALNLSDPDLRHMVGKAQRASAELVDLAEPEPASVPPDEDQPNWQSRLLKSMQSMPPDAFERLCMLILRSNNFVRVEVTGRSNDGGIDGMGVLRLNLLSFHVMFQCKRWKGSVGSAEVRDFRGAMMGRAEKGLIFTTSTFTAAAQAEASRPGATHIDLVDGDAMCALLKEFELGVHVKKIEEIEIDTDFFTRI